MSLLRKQSSAWQPWYAAISCLLIVGGCLNPRPEELPSAELDGNTRNPEAPVAAPEGSIAIVPVADAPGAPLPETDPAPASPQDQFAPAGAEPSSADAGPPPPDASADAG